MDELQRYGLLSIACLIVLCLALTFKDRDHANAKSAKAPIVKPEGVGEGATNDANALAGGDSAPPSKPGGEVANQDAGSKPKAGSDGKVAPDAKESSSGSKSPLAANGSEGKDKATPATNPDLEPSTYKVQAGDTFRKIAKTKLGDEARFAEIVAANPGVKANALKAGATLKIPPKSKPLPPTSPQAESKPGDSVAKDGKNPAPDAASGKNPAAPGDVKSPSGARPKSKKDLAESAATKSDPKSDSKKAAKARTIPTSHKVGRGESLASIARKYYDDATDWKKIYSANKSKMKNSSDIHEGLVLTLP